METRELKNKIYAYLGYRSVEPCAEVDGLIEECLEELESISHFNYLYKYFQTPPEFLLKQPYTAYLEGSRGVILSAMTLGSEVDAKIRLYGRNNAVKSVVLDASASAYLEMLSDEYERGLNENLSYRFCPGYGGSDVSDVRRIFAILRPEKIGMTLTETGYILPSKSMAGVIAVGKNSEKTCGDCIVYDGCRYRKEGKTCYGSEKK